MPYSFRGQFYILFFSQVIGKTYTRARLPVLCIYLEVMKRARNSFEEWWGKYGPSNLEHYSGWMAWGTYLAGIAMLVKQDQIDPQQVSDLLGTYILWSWEKYEPIFKEIRARSDSRERPQLGDWLEYLYNEMKKVEPHSILEE